MSYSWVVKDMMWFVSFIIVLSSGYRSVDHSMLHSSICRGKVGPTSEAYHDPMAIFTLIR